MSILWLAWKDPRHPQAGGAEVVLWQLASRQAADGHQVTILTCGYDGAKDREMVEGIEIIRIGRNRYLHSFQALLYYLGNLRDKFDAVIETVNTAPYFAVLFGGTAKRYLFYHQLAREIWYCETKFPLNSLGFYVLEPVATRMLGWSRAMTITVSESTKRDLMKYGFKPEQVKIISEGIEIKPVTSLAKTKKFKQPTLLSFGALRAMKRTLDQLAAFEAAKQNIPELQLKIAGSANDPSGYGRKVLRAIEASPHKADIEYCGRVSDDDKLKLMQQCHLIMVTSLKEGWGLIVTEANSQGTPAVVYDVDGLRDSVRDGQTGRVTPPVPEDLSRAVTKVLQDRQQYDRLRGNAWEWSKQITFERAYGNLKGIMSI